MFLSNPAFIQKYVRWIAYVIGIVELLEGIVEGGQVLRYLTKILLSRLLRVKLSHVSSLSMVAAYRE